jgi:hypothetical protein
MDPRQLLAGNAVSEPGYGAIRNNATGKVTSIQPNLARLEAEDRVLRRQEGQPVQVGHSGDTVPAALQDLAGQGVFGGLAAMHGLGAIQRTKQNEENAGLRRQQAVATNSLAQAKLRDEQQQRMVDNLLRISAEKRAVGVDQRAAEEVQAKDFDTELRHAASEKIGNAGLTEAGGKQLVDQEHARLEGIARYSVGDRKDGKTYKNLSPTERQQLFQAIAIKDKVEAGWGNLEQKIDDYFGTGKQVDSKNAYSYLPVKVEPAGLGRPFESWVVHMKNGNTVGLKAVVGGGFRLIDSNKPVSADLMQLIAPLIKARLEKGM